MIGIFDSGVGGMTVAHAIEQAFPEQSMVYFGDLARTPYGSKSPETIREYSRQNIEFLIEKGAKLIIIACNSAASVAADEMRAAFELPIFDVIGPAVEKVRAMGLGHVHKTKVGVIGTRATIKSGIYKRKIEAALEKTVVYSQECPLLVPLVEEGWLKRRETKMILKQYLHSLKTRQLDALVLGCTHYPLLKELIQPRIGKRVTIIDSSEAVAQSLKHYLDQDTALSEKLTRGGTSEFYVSDITDAALLTARKIFGRKINLINVGIEAGGHHTV